jgi:competence protein ComEA
MAVQHRLGVLSERRPGPGACDNFDLVPDAEIARAGRESIQEAENRIEMNLSRYSYVVALLLLAGLVGCNAPQNPQELKEKTAETTANAKRDAKAIAQGIREGWSRDKPLDLNSASKEQLASLPGVSSAEADRVIAGRPYNDPSDLVTRRIMSKTEYDRISDRLTAKK